MKRFKNFKKVVVLFLVMMLAVNLLPSNAINVNAAAQPAGFININVTNSTTSKGDATLLDCNGKYVLVDGGSGGDTRN